MISQNLTLQSTQVFWRSWFEAATYGREVFNGDRVFLTSPADFENYVKLCTQNRAPAWMSVQPYNGRNDVSVVEKLFFDFDSRDLNLAWKEATSLAETLRNSYDVEPLICFSGSKGYHVYVWLSKIEQFASAELAKKFYQAAQELLLKGFSFKTLDTQVLGDIKRLSRVPYSVHEKNLNQCAPMNANREVSFLSDMLRFKGYGLRADFCRLCRSKMEQENKRFTRYFATQNNWGVRSCIGEALSVNLAGTTGHSIRIAIATEFLNKGFSAEQTAELFRTQIDFNYEKSLYFVRDILTRGYRPFKCGTIRKLGFCLQNCPRRSKRR